MAKAILLALSSLVAQIAAALLVLLLSLIFPSLKADPITFIGLVTIISHLLLLAWLWWKGHLKGLSGTLRPLRGRIMLYGVIMGLSGIILIDWIMSYLDFLPNIMEDTFEGLERTWIGVTSIVLTAPIAEEILFRGVITRHLAGRYASTFKVVLYSALIFGLIHMNPPQMVAGTLSGVILALLLLKTGSLLPSIIVHAINNAMSVVLSVRYSQDASLMEVTGQAIYWTLICLCLALFSFTCYRLVISTRNPE